MSGRADRPVPCGPYETEQQASGQGGAEAFWFGGGKFDRCITVEEFGHVQFRRFKPRAIYLGDEHPRGLSTPKLLRFTFALVKGFAEIGGLQPEDLDLFLVDLAQAFQLIVLCIERP